MARKINYLKKTIVKFEQSIIFSLELSKLDEYYYFIYTILIDYIK